MQFMMTVDHGKLTVFSTYTVHSRLMLVLHVRVYKNRHYLHEQQGLVHHHHDVDDGCVNSTLQCQYRKVSVRKKTFQELRVTNRSSILSLALAKGCLWQVDNGLDITTKNSISLPSDKLEPSLVVSQATET